MGDNAAVVELVIIVHNTPNENKILVVNITCEEIQEDDKETQNRLTFTITHHCQSEKRKNSKVEIR